LIKEVIIMSNRVKERVYRDPVHDFIALTEPLLIELIDSQEFQRLRRIKQLGATYGTYHGAEHSRFGHSIGALWVMLQVLNRMEDTGHELSPETKVVACCSALLHDCGHGPFSHALEGRMVPGVSHEEWSKRIILGDTGVNRVLAAYDPVLPVKVAEVIQKQWKGPHFIQSLVSSQLDVDRMDYLLRDSLYTGVTYGRFDLKRLINTITIVDDKVVLMSKGIVSAEEYILARYFMYWQVYLHKTIRGQEHILKNLWKRASYLIKEKVMDLTDQLPSLRAFLAGSVRLEDFLAVDDHDLFTAIKQWRTSPDPVLADLCDRFINRRLLKPLFRVPNEERSIPDLTAVKEVLYKKGWDPDYYLVVDDAKDLGYDYYVAKKGEKVSPEAIWATDIDGCPGEISTLSQTIAAVASRRKRAINMYIPEQCIKEVIALFDSRRKAGFV
jgi:HD superfamily phosphohydrolase